MALVLEGVWLWYAGGGGPVLRGVDLEVEPGELVALVGPNGGGKTSVLRVASGLVPHYYPGRVEGRVELDGVDPRVDVAALGVLAAYLQPDPEVQVVGSTVYHEAALAPSLQGLPAGVVEERAWGALRLLGLEDLARVATHRLSMGLLERAALAGVASTGARYLLLDEPTSHLDPAAAEVAAAAVEALARGGSGVVVATHDPRVASRASRVYTVEAGRLREGGAPREPPPPRRPGRSPGRVLLEMEGVEACYPGSREPAVRVERLTVREGELVAVVGPNGSGKTTLLRAAAGALRPCRGRVRWRVKPAYLPSQPILVFSRPTLAEELGGAPPPGWLPPGVLHAPILTLSRGQLQLAALALVASASRGLLLLDEPTTGLDPGNRRAVAEALVAAAEGGAGILVATHDPVVAGAASRVYEATGGVVR